MDRAKYKAAMKLLENPDTHAEGWVMLNDLVTADADAYDASQLSAQETNARIADLLDRNSKLALRVTSKLDGTADDGDEVDAYEALKAKFEAAKEGETK